MEIGASGIVREGTGIGVLQRALYPRLAARGARLSLSTNRDLGGGLRAIEGLLRGFLPARGRFDAYFSVVPPLPIGLTSPVVSVVHDLRWNTTRKGAGRAYRRWDLARTVRRSDAIICISERTRADLVEMFPTAACKTSTAWLGPGLMDERVTSIPSVKEPRTLLLVGKATHKRNLLASEVIRLLDAQVDRVIGVGLDATVQAALKSNANLAVEAYEGIGDDQMRDLYLRAGTFMLLGTQEGFGLPYIEALAAGCAVIAIQQPLTEEILGEAAILCTDSSAGQIAREIRSAEIPDFATRSRVAARYSWDGFADHIIEVVGQVRRKG